MSIVLRVLGGPFQGREYAFDQPARFVVGRSSRAEYSVPDDGFLSRQHFEIGFDPPLCRLTDLNSTNGTKVNGVRVTGLRLRDGDVIEAGQHVFQIQCPIDPGSVRCLGCDRLAPDDEVHPSAPFPTLSFLTCPWVCEACTILRRQFPACPAGYWIEERIGGGGMGEVYQARRLADQRTVAIKMMSQFAAANRKAHRYFRRELEVLRALKHPHIVEFYDMVEIDEQFQLIMEYVNGKNARRWVEQLAAPLSIPSAARIGVQLLMALNHAHELGYVHRDVKPSNLLIYGPHTLPTAKLTDFGLAKSVLQNGGFGSLTHQGDIGGSVGFLSPDHLRDFREVRPPADIYSAGATLYYLLTGQYPYFEFHPQRPDSYEMILEHPAVPLRVHRTDAPELLDRILRKALEKHPRDRWKSAAEMATALRPLVES